MIDDRLLPTIPKPKLPKLKIPKVPNYPSPFCLRLSYRKFSQLLNNTFYLLQLFFTLEQEAQEVVVQILLHFVSTFQQIFMSESLKPKAPTSKTPTLEIFLSYLYKKI